MKGRRPAVDDSAVLIEGPWQHRFVDANGVRFHVVEMGSGPLILLLHGFPEFWWTWQHQIPALAEAGYRVAAVDLRGYGASDKPPDGYDVYTMASDITGLIRALGERDAVVVGHDLGGTLGFAAAGFHPRSFRRLVVLSSRTRCDSGPHWRSTHEASCRPVAICWRSSCPDTNTS